MSGSGFRFLQSKSHWPGMDSRIKKMYPPSCGRHFWLTKTSSPETWCWDIPSLGETEKFNWSFPWSGHWLLSSFRGRNVKKQKPNSTRCFQRCKAALAAAEKASWKRATLLSRESPWNWSVSDPHFLFMLGLLSAKGQKKRCAEAHQNIMLPRLPKYSSGRTQCIRKGINNISFDESQAHQTHDVWNQRLWL